MKKPTARFIDGARYANRPSAAFWKRVNTIVPEAAWEAAYSVALALQENEQRLLRALDTLESGRSTLTPKIKKAVKK